MFFFFIKCAQIASSDGGSEGRDSDIWTEYGGEVDIFTFVKTLSFIFLETLPDGSQEQFAHLHFKSYPEGCGGQVREGEGVHKMETSKEQADPGNRNMMSSIGEFI